jgi:hypothetical protein
VTLTNKSWLCKKSKKQFEHITQTIEREIFGDSDDDMALSDRELDFDTDEEPEKEPAPLPSFKKSATSVTDTMYYLLI